MITSGLFIVINNVLNSHAIFHHFIIFVEKSNKFLNLYKVMDQYFVETKAYEEAEKTFNKSGIVIFTGPPGCGKTISAIHLIRKQLKHSNKLTFRKIYCLEELSYIEKDEQSIIFIDNIFYRKTIDLRLESWWEKLEEIYDNEFAGLKNKTGSHSGRLRIVMTARTNVIKRACDYMGKDTLILNKRLIINTNNLTENEKDDIFANQIKFAEKEKDVSANIFSNMGAEFKQVRESEGPIGFPLCAHLFVCDKDYRKSGVSFFSRPIKYLKVQLRDEIECDKTNRSKSLFFYVFFYEWHAKPGKFEFFDIKSKSPCIQFLDKISPNLVTNFDPFDFSELEDEAKRLSGAFFKEVSDCTYKFIHDSVYEAVGAYFCETYVIKTAKFFPLDIILNQSFENMSDKESVTLATRLLYEALDQRLSEVFSCRVLRQKPFSKLFCAELKNKEPKTIDQFLTTLNKSTAVKFPSMFWSSFFNLTHLTEHLYNIANEQNLDLSYHLYFFLYGICCFKDKSLLKTTNGMLRDNFKKIRERVLKFKDLDGNYIHHHIIRSDCSDWFAALAINQLLKDKLSPDEKNSCRVTPIMFAVENELRRTEVIQTLVNYKSTLHNKDSKGSTVFHHCLGSGNDDETCANYLNILLPEIGYPDCLSKDDENGDTALSIAAKCSKYSRVKSMCMLLKRCAPINTLNEDGYSPLRLVVRSLKRKSDHIELECCTRVIILILNGAGTDKKTDENRRAVDECQYEIVRSVLRKPGDIQSMEIALENLLKKFEQSKEGLELSDVFSEKISDNLKRYVTRAIQQLQSINFDNISPQSS